MEENKQLQIIENSIEQFKQGPAILTKNQNRAIKAVALGNKRLSEWEEADAIKDQEERLNALREVDGRSNDYLVKAATALKEMKEQRSGITQLMTNYAKMFTAAEADMDKAKENSFPWKIQQRRNVLAELEMQIEKLRQKAAEEKRLKEEAKIALRASMTSHIATSLNNFTAQKKTKMTEGFNKITLETFDQMGKALKNAATDFPKDKQEGIVSTEWDKPDLISNEDFQEVLIKSNVDFNYPDFYKSYKEQIEEHKQYLIDRLPSKKTELEEAKALAEENERKQKELEKKAAEDEKKRKQEIENTNSKKEKERLQKLADEQKLADQKKIDDAKKLAELEEQERLDNIKIREDEEKLKQQQELEDNNRKSQEQIEMKANETKALNMFEEMAENASVAHTNQIKTGVEIVMQHPSAWMLIVAFWFDNEGLKLGMDEIGRKSLDQMKKACEAITLKTSKKIDSKLIVYKDTFKAKNVK